MYKFHFKWKVSQQKKISKNEINKMTPFLVYFFSKLKYIHIIFNNNYNNRNNFNCSSIFIDQN